MPKPLASTPVLDRLAALAIEIERPAMLELDVLEPLAPLVAAARVPRLRLAIGGAVHPTIATLRELGPAPHVAG